MQNNNAIDQRPFIQQNDQPIYQPQLQEFNPQSNQPNPYNNAYNPAPYQAGPYHQEQYQPGTTVYQQPNQYVHQEQANYYVPPAPYVYPTNGVAVQPAEPQHVVYNIPGIPVQQTQFRQSADGQKESVRLQCPYCKHVVMTSTETEVGGGACCCSVITLLLCWPCFWIPLCCDDCKDIIHHCPSCGAKVGQHEYQLC